jgi:hypothetical protein
MKTITVSSKTRGGTIADFVTVDDDAVMVESVDSSVPDTTLANNNLGQSKYGHMYRRTTHYDPATGSRIGAEATALANYYTCLKETDGKMEFFQRWSRYRRGV